LVRKYFPLDKNYVLEAAQLQLENSLLTYLVDFVKVEYLLRTNPLGIRDEMAIKIQEHAHNDYRHLHEFYLNLSGVFRFTYYHNNQLEFTFDGRDPFEKYTEEWSVAFKKWVKEFCKHDNFIRAVLDLTVFYPVESPLLMVDNRMQAFLGQHFDLKIHPQKGICKKMA
jgi:hypothetical protein